MPHRISAIVLAAGTSKRFGPENKLLIDWRGKPMIGHVVETVLAAEPGEVIVVIGHEAELIEAALSGLPVRFAFNERYMEGMGTSIACGVRAASPEADGFLIVLGDMPQVTAGLCSGLSAAFCSAKNGAICVPFDGEREGNPVLFDARYRAELCALSGDVGARRIVQAHAPMKVLIEAPQRALSDVDS